MRWPGSRTRCTARTPADHETYDILYREYLRLHDYFGRGENDLMKVLRGLRADAKADRPIAVGA